MFKFLESPWREHEPREDRIDEEDEGKCDTSRHTESLLGMYAFTVRVPRTDLLRKFPQALHTAEHVAAPQHEAANVAS